MTMAKPWTGFGLTHVGKVRETNQDSLLIDDTHGLWIVADGMGGHAGGDVASQLAIETIQKSILERPILPKKADAPIWLEILQDAVHQANAAIRQRGKEEPVLKGMGTTVVFMFMPDTSGEQAYIVHVGDSRAYRIRDQQISALTRDHTLLEERIRVGLLPETTSINHPLGHVLTRGVGVESTVESEISIIELQESDKILLCSDGLMKMMKDDQILEELQNPNYPNKQDKCQRLIDEANNLGGKDNTTVLLVESKE